MKVRDDESEEAVLLSHAVLHCPRLEKVVGEWTRVPDKEISQLEEDCARKGLHVKVRNAEPYREFQNTEDNDRYYGMNEGYWRNQAINPLNLAQAGGQPPQVWQLLPYYGLEESQLCFPGWPGNNFR